MADASPHSHSHSQSQSSHTSETRSQGAATVSTVSTTVSAVTTASASTSTPTTDATGASSANAPARPPKRIRLNLACNNCRRRKVKCDTEQPKCRNCWLRDEECLTTDPRYGAAGDSPDGRRSQIRRWATPNGLMPGQNPAATHRNQATVAKHSTTPITPQCPPSASTRTTRPEPSPGTPRRTSTIVVADTTGTDTPENAISWVSRGYHDAESAEQAQAQEEEGDGMVVDGGGGGGGNGEGSTGPTTVGTTSSYEADVVVNTDDAAPHRVKYLGGSSLQCLAGFVDIFLRRKRLPLVSTGFTSGMRHAEEFSLPLSLTIPRLPPMDVAQAHIAVFFEKIWPLYPVVDRATVEHDLHHFHAMERAALPSGGLQAVLSHDEVPPFAVLLAVLSIGAGEGDAQAQADLNDTESGLSYITAGFCLVAHLISRPYLRTVQALVLLSIGLRLRAHDGQSWYLLGQAVRVAHSIGLHRQIGGETTSKGEPSLQSRVWWSLYAQEKLLEFETGRPSAIYDDEPLPLPQLPTTKDAADVFPHWVSLATIVAQTSRRLYVQKPASAAALLHEIGRLDQQLQSWVAALPEQLKPSYDVVTSAASPSTAVLTTFLALQYYQVQMAVLRAAIIFPTRTFATEVEKAFPPGAPMPTGNKHRLLQAESLCTAAARSTIHRVLDLADGVAASSSSHLLSPTLTFHAAVVLALHILRAPGKRLVRSDCELLASATQHLEMQYADAGQHPGFVRGIATLRTSVIAAVDQHTGNTPSSTATRERRESFIPSMTMDMPSLDASYNNYAAPSVPSMDMAFFDMDGDNMGHLEAFWNAMGPVNFLDTELEGT